MSDGFAVEMRGITKTFGSVVANRDVDLEGYDSADPFADSDLPVKLDE